MAQRSNSREPPASPPQDTQAPESETPQAIYDSTLRAILPPDVICPTGGDPTLADWPGIGAVRVRKQRQTGAAEISSLIFEEAKLPIIHSVSQITTEGRRDLFYDVEILGRRARFNKDDLMHGDWLAHFPELDVSPKGRNVDTYLSVFASRAARAPKLQVYDVPAWQWLAGEDGRDHYVYITPDGRVVGSPGVSVMIDTEGAFSDDSLDAWRRLDIEAEAPSPERQQQAYELLKNLSDRRQPLIFFTHAFLALLAGIRSDTFALGHFLLAQAERASGKTSLAGAARSIVSPLRWNGHTYVPDVRFNDTVTSLEMDLAHYRYMPAIVDDLHDKLTESEDAQAAKAIDALARSLFEGVAVRKRRTHRLKRQRENKLEGAFFATLEVIPHHVVNSLLRRVLLVTLRQQEIKKKGVDSLESLNAFADVYSYWGYQLIRELRTAIDDRGQGQAPREGLRLFAGDLAREYRNNQEVIEQRLYDLWRLKHAHIEMPEDVHSLVEIAAAELLAFSWWQVASDAGGEEADILPALVETIAHQIETILDMRPDDEEGPLFERALKGVLGEIGRMKLSDRQRCRIVSRLAAPRLETGTPDDDEQPPCLRAENGVEYGRIQWGWEKASHRLDSDREQVSNLPRDVAYVEAEADTMPSRGKLYLTSDFTMMMLDWLREHRADGAPTTEKALTLLAEREGWIIERGDGRNIRKNVTQHRRVERCLVIDLARALRLVGSPEPEATPRPPFSPDDTREVNTILAGLDTPEELPETPSALWPVASQSSTEAKRPLAPCTFFDDCGHPGVGYSPSGVWLCQQCATTLEVRIAS